MLKYWLQEVKYPDRGGPQSSLQLVGLEESLEGRDVVALPDVVAQPDVAAQPEVVAEPEVVAQPNVLAQPNVVAQPQDVKELFEENFGDKSNLRD